MAAPVGSIWQVSFVTIVNEQKCLNVFHYRTVVEPIVADIATESIQLATALEAADKLGPDFAACLALNATRRETVAQCIRDTFGTRYARQVLELNEAGTQAFECTAQNLTAVIIKRTIYSGRWAVGGTHVPAVPSNGYQDGLLNTAPYKGALGVLAAEIAENITTAAGGEYEPGLYHPDGQHNWFTPIVETELVDELRVLRRRNVGQGI